MDWRYNTIWFEQINPQQILDTSYTEKSNKKLDLEDIEYSIIWHYKSEERNFAKMPNSESLKYLEFNWANSVNFQGLEKFSNLKRLELHYCTKLESDVGISALKNSLEYLHINQSKKFQFSHELCELKDLRVLALNDCGPIPNLHFLKHFPKLIDFRFVNSNIIDGDLSPILEHPTIRTAAFLNKRHYNYKDDKLEDALFLKSSEEYRDYVYKGEFVTSKYSYSS